MERSAYRHSMDRMARWLVLLRTGLLHIAPYLAIGFGCGIAAQIAEAVLPRMLGDSWPSWGGFACSVAGPGLAVVTILIWSIMRDRPLRPAR